jgi:hypothetical protein
LTPIGTFRQFRKLDSRKIAEKVSNECANWPMRRLLLRRYI